jgi:hypothetical protein
LRRLFFVAQQYRAIPERAYRSIEGCRT